MAFMVEANINPNIDDNLENNICDETKGCAFKSVSKNTVHWTSWYDEEYATYKRPSSSKTIPADPAQDKVHVDLSPRKRSTRKRTQNVLLNIGGTKGKTYKQQTGNKVSTTKKKKASTKKKKKVSAAVPRKRRTSEKASETQDI
jgi:hypothetical protein